MKYEEIILILLTKEIKSAIEEIDKVRNVVRESALETDDKGEILKKVRKLPSLRKSTINKTPILKDGDKKER